MRKVNIFWFSIAVVIWMGLNRSVGAATITVTNWADSGTGTLREAVDTSNNTAGIQTVVFAVSNSITVLTPLSITTPIIIEGGGTTIGSVGLDVLQLNSGSDGSIIRCLAVVNGNSDNASGIYVHSNSNTISGCAIGTDWVSHIGKGNYYGIDLNGNDNIIGGNTPDTRNVISGNSIGYDGTGIYIGGDRNQITGNYIGTASDGMAALPNHDGIYSVYGFTTTLIGGNRNQGEGNLISGNTVGILSSGSDIICGNIVGLNRDQTAAIPNSEGVWISGENSVVGVRQVGKENILAGNDIINLWLSGDNTIVCNNLIGISSNEAVFEGILPSGIQIWSNNNLIGSVYGPGGFAKNVISGNTSAIVFCGASGNSICGNYIGTNSSAGSIIQNTSNFSASDDPEFNSEVQHLTV
jgi:hypothetical protein